MVQPLQFSDPRLQSELPLTGGKTPLLIIQDFESVNPKRFSSASLLSSCIKRGLPIRRISTQQGFTSKRLSPLQKRQQFSKISQFFMANFGGISLETSVRGDLLIDASDFSVASSQRKVDIFSFRQQQTAGKAHSIAWNVHLMWRPW